MSLQLTFLEIPPNTPGTVFNHLVKKKVDIKGIYITTLSFDEVPL